jgi:hypothetical protein
MFDLQVLAYKTQITRISTLMLARENSGATYPQRASARASTMRRITRTIARTWINSR